MDDNGFSAQVSRRTLLKRVGAGAAIVWSAPVLTSLHAPAFAQSAACVGCPDGNCGTEPVLCADSCVCDKTDAGTCFCRTFPVTCDQAPVCATSADCPPGWACLPGTCCDPPGRCAPPCGVRPEGVGGRDITERA